MQRDAPQQYSGHSPRNTDNTRRINVWAKIQDVVLLLGILEQKYRAPVALDVNVI